MNSSRTTEAVLEFLTTNSDRAFLISEVVAAVRARSDGEIEVVGAVNELADKGKVFSRLFPVSDPHLAFTSLQFVAAVDSSGDSRQAQLRTERAFQAWLREWLSSHRCS